MPEFFKISEKEAGLRLDKFLQKEYGSLQVSRSYLQKLIKRGNVLVSQQPVKPSYLLKKDDRLEVKIILPPKLSLTPDASINLNIVYEDDDLIVVNKPAGLTVHPSQNETAGTLANALLAYYPPIKNVGENPLRPGLVHRLDKETSGLMVIAKNNQIFFWLKNQFQKRQVIKKYLALVYGRLKEKQGTIELSIGRSPGQPWKQTISSEARKRRDAISEYKVIREYDNFSLVEVQPKTGRLHQIRVHLASIGHPVVNDPKYRFKNQKLLAGLRRQFLHAAYLKFSLPSKEIKEFAIDLPTDLNSIIANLKRSK